MQVAHDVHRRSDVDDAVFAGDDVHQCCAHELYHTGEAGDVVLWDD